jgi:hypothetical protein
MTKTQDDDWPELPPELKQAPREFGDWSDRRLLEVEEAESTPTQPLYHYTGEGALKGILENERLWCFSHLHQSDKREFAFSFEIARRVIREIGASEDQPTHWLCYCLDDLLETHGLDTIFEFYLFSLSRHRDVQSQWELYGDKGRGFAIGFAPDLFQPTQALSEQANENVHMGRVLYGKKPTEARHRLVITTAAEIIDRIGRENQSLKTRLKPSIYLNAMAKEVIARQLIWNCLTAKRSRFAVEQEVRCILMGMRDRFAPHRKIFNGRPYVETPLPLKGCGNIAEILLGPKAPPDAQEMVEAFLHANGYAYPIPVTRSAVAKLKVKGVPSRRRAGGL